MIDQTDRIQNKRIKIPHLLKYMGSKREIIEFVKDSIEELDAKSEWLCDLFAGTGVVSGSLKNKYNIHVNDIQAYSAVLSQTYLTNLKGTISPLELEKIKHQVQKIVRQLSAHKNSSSFDYSKIHNLKDFIKVEAEQQAMQTKTWNIEYHLFTKYYSGTYWSFDQCVWIDSIRAVAEQYNKKPEYFAILSSLIFAMSYTSQSTGHYAQYRDARKESSMKDIMLYRKKEIWPHFERKFIELTTTLNGNAKEFKVTTLDYIECLKIIEKGSIVYADPPYQSVHYSRFYHVLETLVKYDYPKVLFKGRYRDDRHQSDFCKRSSVKNAFISLFEGVRFAKSHLVLSYSDTGMISLEELKHLSALTFGNEYSNNVLTIDHKHSKMGRNDMKNSDVKEYTLLFKRLKK